MSTHNITQSGYTQTATNPPRSLTLLDATCIVIGAIVGVGIFFTPSRIAALTGDASHALIAWIIAGGIALSGALAFAYLGKHNTGNGAQYTILRNCYGRAVGFVFVFCNCTAVQAGSAAIIAIICLQNLLAAFGIPNISQPFITGMACILIFVTAGANILGVRTGATIAAFTVFTKIAALLGIVALAMLLGPGQTTAASQTQPTTLLSPLAAILAALVPAFFAYGGWQHALWIAGEIKDPQRNLPRSVIGGVLVVIITYVSVNWAYLHLLGVGGVSTSKALAADAVAVHFPAWAHRALALAIGISAFGVLNAQFLAGPRLVSTMAASGQFFPLFARTRGTRGTPVAAICLLAVIAITLLLAAGMNGVDRLLTGVVLLDGIFFLLTAASLLTRRNISPVPIATKIAAVIFCLGEAGIIVGATLDPATRAATWIGGVWIIAAVVLYFACFRGNKST